LEVVKLLIEKGADITQADRNGWIFLHWTSNNRHLELVKLLIEKSADEHSFPNLRIEVKEPRSNFQTSTLFWDSLGRVSIPQWARMHFCPQILSSDRNHREFPESKRDLYLIYSPKHDKIQAYLCD
jgi:ankyrin repeat protein